MKRFVTIAFLLLVLLTEPPRVLGVSLHYSTDKTYGPIDQKIIVEVPGDNPSAAQSIYSLFSSSKPYLKLTRPSSGFINTSSFTVYNSFAGGWYLSLPPENSSLDTVSSFSSASSLPLVVEITPYDASFINTLHGRFPNVKIHTAQFLYWPRSDVKNVLSQTPPPIIDAVSIYVEESKGSDMFAAVKLMFDTFFDASMDIPGTSGIKIQYPTGSLLSLSDIRTKMNDDSKNTAYRFAVAGAAAVTQVQSQGKGGKAPIRYVGIGTYVNMSQSSRILSGRYAKFISLHPSIVWPMAIGGNGDPYDNPFIEDSNSKPIVGVIGLIQGGLEGVIINASSQSVPVSLPSSTGSPNAYSSQIGSFIFGSSFQMSPGEVIIFGDQSSKTTGSSPPPIINTPTMTPRQPTLIPPTPTLPPVSLPTAAISLPSPTPVFFPIEGQEPPMPQTTPVQNQTMEQSLLFAKNNVRLTVIKTDPLLQQIKSLFLLIKQYDESLEKQINSMVLKLFLSVFNR